MAVWYGYLMQWFEDESFWRDLYPFMFHAGRWADAEGEVDAVLRLSGASTPAHARVLDLCCGPARHSVPLARRGFEVTAVDRSAFLLDQARERAAGLAIEFAQADARDFVRDSAFDLAINLFTSFGYFETREEDEQVLRNLRRCLRPEGVLVLDVLGREPFTRLPAHTRWTESEGGSVVVQHATPLENGARVENRWLLVRGEHAQHFRFVLNLYSGGELRAMLERVGFGDVRLFGGLTGVAYDDAATRLVAVARA